MIIRYPVPMVFTAASGGTETSYTENGTNYHAHIFATTGTDTLTVTHGGELEVLVVAGGGGGGQWNAGGGGAGGLIYTSTVVDAGSYSVTVGSGGAGGVGGTAHEDGRSGSKGSDSVFGALTAFGGGGGGAYRDGLATSGGSGGGGGWKAGGSLIAAGTEGQGNAGGAEQSTGNTFAGAGGGGAGAEGESLTPGNGGAGLEYPQFASFAGSPAGWFAGGGGGGGNGGSGTGGIGGGGAGQNQVTPASGGTPGVANTGGGGGGGGETGKGPGGAGGSGIVIVRYQAHPNDHLINLDINGYSPSDGLPWTSKCYSGAAVVGAAGDFWNSAAIADSTFETLTAPLLKLADGLTSSTVRFSISRPGGLLRGDCREPDNSVTALLTDYVYLSHENQDSDTFTISGLVPSAAYDLYIYCHAGDAATPGRFTIGGINYDSVNDWLTTGDYAFCPGIAADGNGVITGTFSRLTEGGDAVINGLQIVGTFPVSQAEIVSLDLNGFFGTPPGAGATYSGAARVGWAGDFWNSVAVSDGTVSIAAPNLKLANSIPTTTTVSFSLSTVGGGVVHGNGRPSLNAMFSDYVFIADGSTNRFTIAGLVPNATYDLYFYCHEFNLYNPGRFVINGLTYDSIDMSFPASGGGDTAVCAGITADGSGKITGDVSQAVWNLPVVVNSLQIVGTFPRQHADLVNIDLNGYGPGDDPPPVAGDTYSGAARVGADGDYWNSLTIATETVPSITVPRLKFADGTTKSAVSFTIGRVDGLLNADRIDPANYLNSLMGDYVYYYDGTGTFTIAGLVPNTAYDLYFYCGAGSIYFPVRFEINGATYDSFDRWFAGSTYGDHAVCAGIMADGSGSISGTIYKAIPGSATCVCGVQIMGKIPRMPQGTIIFVR